MATANPFVYGEMVTAGGVRRSRRGARRGWRRDLARGPEGLPHLAAPLRQVVAHPRRDETLARRRRPDGRGDRGRVELVRRLSRGLRARAARRRHAGRAGSAAGPSELLQGVRPEVRFDAQPAGPAALLRRRFPTVRTARDTARLAAEVFALPGPHRRGAQAADGGRARRVPGHRGVRRRQRRARAARRRAGAAHRSATSSPDRSRR